MTDRGRLMSARARRRHAGTGEPSSSSSPAAKRRPSFKAAGWLGSGAFSGLGQPAAPDPIYRVPGPASCLEPDRDPAWSQLAGSPINPNRSPSQLAASKRLPTSRPPQRAGHIEVTLHRSDQRAAPTRLFKSDREQHAAQIRKSIRNRASQLPKKRCMTVFEPASCPKPPTDCSSSQPAAPNRRRTFLGQPAAPRARPAGCHESPSRSSLDPASWVTGRAGCPISCPRMPIP
jgi:hypothetical protein